MTQKIKIALIYGSTREGRFCDTVVDWAAREIDNHGGFTLDLIDPAALTLPGQDQGKTDLSANALQERIELADAFVVVTPEYNHGYTAGLKFLIDSVYSQWHAKPVAFVSYGGISDGLRAVEQLRLVFAELHAVTVRDSISFPNYWECSIAPANCGTPRMRKSPWPGCWSTCAGGQMPCAKRVG